MVGLTGPGRPAVWATAVADDVVVLEGPDAPVVAERLRPGLVDVSGGWDRTRTSGPYRVADAAHPELALVNSQAGHDLPRIVRFLAEPDQDRSVAALRAGALDVVLEADEHSVTGIEDVASVVVIPDQAHTVQMLGFNLSPHRNLGVEVRRGLGGVIDTAAVAAGPYCSRARARPALVHGPSSVPKNPLVLVVNAENRLRIRAATVLVEQWAASGVEVAIDVEPWPRFYDRIWRGDFDLYLVSVRTGVGCNSLWDPQHGALARLHASGAPRPPSNDALQQAKWLDDWVRDQVPTVGVTEHDLMALVRLGADADVDLALASFGCRPSGTVTGKTAVPS